MNSLWPAASRFSCANAHPILKTCLKLDGPASRLVQRSIRSYSIFSLQCTRSNSARLARRLSDRKNISATLTWNLGLGSARTFAARKKLITQWEKLPESYTDEEGIDFRNRPLSKEEVLSIFGKGIDPNAANHILRVMQGRRVAGTLQDPDVPNYLSPPLRFANDVALEWLRQNVPVDEIRSAGLRADWELAELEETIIADGEKFGLYKRDLKDKGVKREESKSMNSVYGKSGLDYIREQKEKALDMKDAEEKKKLSQADEIRYNTGTLEPVKARGRVELRRKGENPLLKYYIERSKILPNTPPEMTMFQRLWPSGLLTLAVVGFCLVLPLLYTTPPNSQRLFPDIPPAAATVLGIMAINFLVFAAWHSPPFFRVLNKYFITVPGYPFAASLFGNMFSHQQFSHLATNMFVLYFVGSRLHDEVGRANFLAIYLSSGMMGSLFSLTSFVVRNSFVSSALGASGAVAGVIATYLWLNRSEAVTLFGLSKFIGEDGWLRMPCWVPLAGMVGMETIYAIRTHKKPSHLDHWAHLGGYFTGIVGAEVIRARVNRRKHLEIEREEERRKKLGFIDRVKEGRL